MYILILCPLLRGFITELEFFGRKKTMALGFMGAMLISICCILDDNYLSFKLGSLNFFINISLGLVSVYTSEVYPTRLRSEALGIGNAFTRIGGITAPFICETVERIIYKGSFFVFAFIGFISAIISFRLSR
jgi:sugar phosphate permease